MPDYYANAKRRIPRLRQAIEHCRLLQEPFRRNRHRLVRHYAGFRYSDDGATKPRPVNLGKLFVNIVVRHLVATNPRCMLGTFNMQHKPVIASMERHVNNYIERMKLDEALRRCAMDSLFLMGIMKVGLSTPLEVEMEKGRSVAKAFAAPIDPDDWVHDMAVKMIHHACFQGHRFRPPVDAIKESKRYKPLKDKVAPVYRIYNEQGDERIGTISQGQYGDPDEYEDHSELWEIYLPKVGQNGVIVSMLCEGDDEAVFEDWLGPELGPFHHLHMNPVPGQSMPSAPLSDLVELDDLINNCYRKLGDQARDHKEFCVVRDEATGNTIKDVRNGQIIVGDPGSFTMASTGGVNAELFNFSVHLRGLFAYMAGNMDALGGLGPQAPTLGQEEMLTQSASRIVNEMQGRVVSFTRSILSALCWYEWHNPYETYKVTKPIEGLKDLEITSLLTPQQRLIPWEEMQVDVDPFSMGDESPKSRLAALNQLMTQILVPMAPLLAQRGRTPNIEKYLEMFAHLANNPEVPELVEPALEMEQYASEGGAVAENLSNMGTSTTRRYVRENRSQRSLHGQDVALQQTLMGKGGQESEQRMLGA